MAREIPVDREEEIELFNTMLSGKTEERILLIEAQSGMGKTILLGEFSHCKPKRIDFAKIDFKGGGTSIAELFYRLRDKLGRFVISQHFHQTHSRSNGAIVRKPFDQIRVFS